MILEFHDNLGRPQRVEATRLVVYDSLHHNPLIVCVEWERGGQFISKYDEADFNQVLHNLGLRHTVICTEIQERPIQDIRFDAVSAF